MQRLVSSIEVARLLGVTASAVSNWQKRGSGPLPEPEYVYRSGQGRLAPLWTVEQIEEVLAHQEAKRQSELQKFRSIGGVDET